MKSRNFLACAAAALVLALPGAVVAQQQVATTAKFVNLRAGPGREYPIVAVIRPQTAVTLYGCTESYRWCDIQAEYERGWVYAGNLLYPYEERVVVLPSIAALVGIGVVTFALDDYWRDHYQERWWYPHRRRWYRPAPLPPTRAQPPGAPHFAPGPHRVDPGRPHVEPGPQDQPGPPQPRRLPPRSQAAPHVEPGPQDR